MNALKGALSGMAAKMSSAAKEGGSGGGGGGGGGAGKLVLALAGLGGIAVTINSSIVTVQPGHLGVVYNRIGGLNEISSLTEGINFVVPFFQRGVVYDIRTRPQVINSQSGSKDLQMVQISLRVLFKPDPEYLPFIYRRLGKDYEERVLPSIVNEVTKAVVAQYNASELLTKRDIVSTEIKNLLSNRANDFKIKLEDVSITHLAFSKEYTGAVEAKQVAQQDAERSKYVVERAIQEKKMIILKAEGEAASATLIGNAIQNNPGYVQLRRIDAAKEIANTINSSQNKVYIDADSLLLNSLGDVGVVAAKK